MNSKMIFGVGTLLLLSMSLSTRAEVPRHSARTLDGVRTTNACQSADVVGLGDPIDGKATLCSSRRGLAAIANAENFNPGDAYTVWWVYFDQPSACEVPNQCGLADFGGENPLGVFGRMDSVVAQESGRVIFRDTLRDFAPAEGSQVWLLVFGHGPVDEVDARHRARQLLTPEDPHAGAPHLGNMIDGPLGYPAAVAVFPID